MMSRMASRCKTRKTLAAGEMSLQKMGHVHGMSSMWDTGAQ
jgi:hypothetical protein